MAKFSIIIARSAQKELDNLTGPIFARIDAKILALADNPRPSGCKKLRGYTDLWRIRVGDYRVIYAVDDEALSLNVLRIRHRKDVYEGR